jgi:type VI secretion system protein ImpH
VSIALQSWSQETWRYDFFAVMRRLEAVAATTPRWGKALLPQTEPIRVGQDPSMAFAPAGLSRLENETVNQRPLLRQNFFGYLGPNGPLPSHLSEFVRERAHSFGDPTWLAFLDGFTHRFALHFYRAWMQARPAVSLDRPHEDHFRAQVGSFVGVGTPARQHRDAIHDDARLHFAGHLTRQIRNAEALQSVVRSYFDVPVEVERWTGRWMSLPASETTRLGRGDVSRALGVGAVLGKAVWDRQHQVRLVLGPLTLEQYEKFLPNGSAPQVLRSWMRQLLGEEFDWDAKLVLCKDHVPSTRLGQRHGKGARLGWHTWLGSRARQHDAQDVTLPGHTQRDFSHL